MNASTAEVINYYSTWLLFGQTLLGTIACFFDFLILFHLRFAQRLRGFDFLLALSFFSLGTQVQPIPAFSSSIYAFLRFFLCCDIHL